MTTIPTLNPVKRGQTFSIDFSIDSTIGALVDNIACQPKNSLTGALIAALTVTPLGATGTKHHWTLSATSAETLLWPLVTLNCDIKFEFTGGAIDFSDTFKIPVTASNTPLDA